MIDNECALCGHTGAIHYSGDEPDTLTGLTSGCVYHDSEGPCLCTGHVNIEPNTEKKEQA